MNDSWGTPLWLVELLEEAFGPFDLDAAAEPWSAVCRRYVTEQQDIFKYTPSGSHVMGNWPYSQGQLARLVPFARKQVLERNWRAVSQPIPHYTAEGWWKRWVATPEGKPVKAEWRYGWLPAPLESWVRLTSSGLVTDIIAVGKRLAFRPPPRWRGRRETARFSSAVVRFSLDGIK